MIEDLDRYFDGRRNAPSPWADAKLFQTRIRRNIRLAECPSFGQSIFQYAPSSRVPRTTPRSPPRCRAASPPRLGGAEGGRGLGTVRGDAGR